MKWFGVDYSFTGNQAAVIEVLWEAWENGTPEVGNAKLIEAADSESKRLRGVFKNHPAWGSMIVAGKTKGSHRLVSPTREPSGVDSV